MTTDREEQGRKLGEVIKKAWEDEAFMARLLEDATTVLAEEGIKLPEGMKVQAVMNTDNQSYFIIPSKPSRAVSDEEMEAVAGGWTEACRTDWCRRTEAWRDWCL